MTDAEILTYVEQRMSNGQSFTFGSLHRGLPDTAYRIADRAIQKWRRKGWIAFTREGRNAVWRLTESAPYGPALD